MGVEDPLRSVEADILSTPAAGRLAIRGAILRVVGFGLGVGLSVIAAALLIRHLGPADFGRYTAVIAVVTILAALAEAGMTNIGVREYSVLPPGDREQFVRGLAGLRLTTTCVGALAAVVFALVAGYNREMVIGSALVGLGFVVYAVQASWLVPLQARLRLGWVTVLELVRQAVTVAAIALLVLWGASLIPLFGVTAIASVVALLATVPLVRRLVPLMPTLRGTEWRRLLRLTVPFAAANAVGSVYIYLAVVLLSLVSTEQQTGFFSASFRIYVVLGAIPGLIVASAFPILARAARDDDTRLAYALDRLWQILLLLGAGIALCTAVGAELAIDVVAGEDFSASAPVLQIQALALFAAFLVAVWGFALLSLSLYRSILVANALALAISVLLTLTLAPTYGAEGAAVANVVAETALGTGYAFFLLRGRPDLRVSLGIVPRILAALVLAGLVLLVPGLSGAARLLAVAGVYAAGVWLLRAIPAEVGQALRRGPESNV